jgi:hypothetical protein
MAYRCDALADDAPADDPADEGALLAAGAEEPELIWPPPLDPPE